MSLKHMSVEEWEEIFRANPKAMEESKKLVPKISSRPNGLATYELNMVIALQRVRMRRVS